VDFLRTVSAREDLPDGLQQEIVRSCEAFPLRIWIIDNSGSMGTNDGKRLVAHPPCGEPHFEKCTRWQELCTTLAWHARMAAHLAAPTEFRLLNPADNGATQVLQCGVGPEPTSEIREMEKMLASLPGGRTPLCAQISAVVSRVRAEAPQLRATGKRAIVVIASDGASTDGDVEHALRPLQDLPVWVVVRLCTDEDAVVEYWNTVDGDLELEMDVLDDLKGEADEIGKKNPYITYGEPLHRLREWGTCAKVLDHLDERLLSPSELMDVVDLVAGQGGGVMRPGVEDMAAVTNYVKEKNKNMTKTWCPVRQKRDDWFRVNKIQKAYKGSCCVS
jgi:hypothetical protein